MQVVLETSDLKATVLTYGAILQNLIVNTTKGPVDVVAGFNDPADYAENQPYFGATIGRVCNRIENGRFTLDGIDYSLPINNGPNSLHGGLHGFDKREWTVEFKDDTTVTLSLISKDQEEGYPGLVKSTVSYKLIGNSLEISFKSELIQGTGSIVNLTNHSYFNLKGFSESVLNHQLTLYSDYYFQLNENQIPTFKQKVADSDFWFQKHSIGSRIQNVQQFKGYDHFYIANSRGMRPVALLETDGLVLQVSSDAIGFQLYTANWLDGSTKHKQSHQPYAQYSGVCIETSAPPNAINSEYRDSSTRELELQASEISETLELKIYDKSATRALVVDQSAHNKLQEVYSSEYRVIRQDTQKLLVFFYSLDTACRFKEILRASFLSAESADFEMLKNQGTLFVPVQAPIQESKRVFSEFGAIKRIANVTKGLVVEFIDVRSAQTVFNVLSANGYAVRFLEEKPNFCKFLGPWQAFTNCDQSLVSTNQKKLDSKSSCSLVDPSVVNKRVQGHIQPGVITDFTNLNQKTTFMIRNIPNKYSQEMLIEWLNENFKGKYDFLYLRMDFVNQCNVGYAFINFTSSSSALEFAHRHVGFKWPRFNSDKICMLSFAKVQGIDALIEKFRNSSVMLEKESYRPKLFNKGVEIEFPNPTFALHRKHNVLFSRAKCRH